MKRTISILLVLAMLLCLPLPAGAEESRTTVTVTADKTQVYPGDSLTLTITASNQIEDLTAWQFNLSYDASRFTMGTPQISPEAWPSTVVGQPKGTKEASVAISALDVGSAPICLNGGQMVQIPFTAKADAVLGQADFVLTCDTLSTYGMLEEKREQVTITNQARAISVLEREKHTYYNGYAVTLQTEKTTSLSQTLSVQAAVSAKDETVTTYSAYELVIAYDDTKLTYKSATAADSGATVTPGKGTVTILGYGEEKTFQTPAATVVFQPKEEGKTNVTLTSARVDIHSNAPTQDVPLADMVNPEEITIQASFPVTLGEGLTAKTDIAVKGTDFSFSATDVINYDYALPQAQIGKDTVAVKDNGDGTYTISGELITGPVSITAARTPKRYPVTVTGSGKEAVTAAQTATYGTDFTFTVAQTEGVSYTVTAKAGNQDVTLTVGEDGSYTIAGTAIAGPVELTVVGSTTGENTVSVTRPDYVTGEKTAAKGQDYLFGVNREDGYTYGEPAVTVDGVPVDVVKEEDGSYKIAGKNVTGPIVITLNREEKTAVTVSEYLTLKDGKIMWLITVRGNVPQGQAPAYDGNIMFWSENYGAYAWLEISAQNQEGQLAQAKQKLTIAQGTAQTVAASGDVNKTGKADINDAQLAYDMYNKHYCDFDTVSVEKFLRADVRSDKKVDTQDAAAIVSIIWGK